jgi:hypothetical protein
MNLLCCQVAGRVDRTGVGHTCEVGRLLLGHTFRLRGVGWGSTGHYWDNAGEHVSRFIGSDPLPRFQIMWGSCLKVWRATYRFRQRMISGVDRPSVLLLATYRLFM